MKKVMLYVLMLLSFVMLISCSKDIKNLNEETEAHKYSCQYKDRKRIFYLYTPEKENLNDTKLVVMLHGYGSSGWAFEKDTGFEKDALPKDYAVLYISGVPNPGVKTSAPGWNYNYDRNGKTDINFIIDLVSFVQKKYGLSHIAYVVGFSNGAFMTNKLAVEKSKYFDGFVSVGGMMPESVWNHRKKAKVRFFQINGTKDEVTPMRLNDSTKYNPNPAMEDVIDYFVEMNGIKTEPVVEQVNSKIKITKYEDKVWWLLIDKYPHSWPTRRYCELNINDIILDFFEN